MKDLADNILETWMNETVIPENRKKYARIIEKGSRKLKESLVQGKITIDEAYEKSTVHVSNNSGKYEWYTPSKFIEAARKTMGSIDLDPASSEIANRVVHAKEFYTKETNGLNYTWKGNIWMNPPYNNSLVTDFTEKLVKEMPGINQACVLVNNATETRWFQNLLNHSDAVCFLKGRIKFWDENGLPNGTSLQGQAILYFGKSVAEFSKNFGEFGTIMRIIKE